MESFSRESTKYSITVNELQELMTYHGENGILRINKLGGIKELCNKIQTSPTEGLSGQLEDLKQRKQTFGNNKFPTKKPKMFLQLLWEAFQNAILITLVISAIISILINFYIGTPKEEDNDEENHVIRIEGVAILVSVFVIVIIAALNDYAKQKQFQNLKNQINKEIKFSVIRQNDIKQILVTEIVVGDICQVKYGDLLPADGILIKSNELKVDESLLTGKQDHVVKGESVDPMLFSGTHVLEGSGTMVVTAVGINSQVGNIYMSNLISAITNLNYKKTKTFETNEGTNFLKGNDNIKVISQINKIQAKENSSTIFIGSQKESINTISSITNNFNTYNVSLKEVHKTHMNRKEDKSILQAKLTKLAINITCVASSITVLIVLICILQFCIKLFITQRKKWDKVYISEFVSYFIFGVSLLLISIPQGLPLVVTLALAYSVKKMINDYNLVRHLDACETMGYATTICSDKTGTLTTNKMTVAESYICETLNKTVPKFSSIPPNVADLIIKAISINSSYTSRITPPDAITGEQGKPVGNKTDCALLRFVLDLGQSYQEVRHEFPEHNFTRVYTFNSTRKSMSTVIPKQGGGYELFSKGASEILLQKCTYIYDYNGALMKFTKDRQEYLQNFVIEPMARDGLRTITIAYREFVYGKTDINQVNIYFEPDWNDEGYICKNLNLLCVVGIEDPVRPEVPDAIRKCQRAGITVRMITGDNIDNARSIALKCGILKSNRNYEIIESSEFNRRIRNADGEIQQHLLDTVWPNLRVLARSSPADKYNLVNGIINSKISSEVVAVTGDGTNDAPALKKADVGFSMGITGTDVAKEASDIIVTDDNFNSIVKAVMWGRNIYDNITKIIQFQLTVSIVAVIVTFVSACTLGDNPLKAVHLLWLNLIIDTLASLALATERPKSALLLRKPFKRTRPLISKLMMRNIIGQALYQLAVLFGLLFYGAEALHFSVDLDYVEGRGPKYTIVFNTFIMMTLFNQINSRNVCGEINMFRGICKTYNFCIIWIISVLCQGLIVQFGSNIFATEGLEIHQWLWCIFFGIGSLIWGLLLSTIPTKKFPKVLSWGQGQPDKYLKAVEWVDDNRTERASVLWFQSKNRLQHQLNVAKEFRSSIDINNKKSYKSYNF